MNTYQLAQAAFTMPTPVTNPTGYSGLASQGALLDNVVSSTVVLIGILFLIYLIFGAFKYITAGGDDKAVDAAKKVLTNATVGITLAVGAFFIVDIVGEVLGFNTGILTGILTPTFQGATGTYSIQILNPTGYGAAPAAGTAASPLGIFLNNVIEAGFVLGGILLLVYLLFGGIKYMTAGGDDKATQSAKNMMTNAVIGILIMTVSFFIVRIAGTVLGMPNILNPVFPGP